MPSVLVISPIFVPLRETFSARSEEHTSELQSRLHLVCRLLLEKKKNKLSDNSPRRPAAHTVHSVVTNIAIRCRRLLHEEVLIRVDVFMIRPLAVLRQTHTTAIT